MKGTRRWDAIKTTNPLQEWYFPVSDEIMGGTSREGNINTRRVQTSAVSLRDDAVTRTINFYGIRMQKQKKDAREKKFKKHHESVANEMSTVQETTTLAGDSKS